MNGNEESVAGGDEQRTVLIVIFGKRAMGLLPGEEVVEWAVSELVQGNDSPHLRVLAGLSKPFHWSEVDEVFRKTLHELQIREPDHEAALWGYARQIAHEVLSDRMAAPEACALLSALRWDMDFMKELPMWDQLNFAWEEICDGYEPDPCFGLTQETFTESVKTEARKLLQLTARKGL